MRSRPGKTKTVDECEAVLIHVMMDNDSNQQEISFSVIDLDGFRP